MNRLPPVLARDYWRDRLGAYLLLAAAMTIIAGIIGGIVTASDMIGWN